jgi:two-component system, LytTR family, response regulator
MKTLIVDDEPLARKVLREELELLPKIEIVGEADAGETALSLIESLRPDLVFLDLQMPGIGGFDVIRRLGSGPLPVVIVVTAYDQYAIRAFEAGAVDYLLKPVGHERLLTAVQRAERLSYKPAEVAEHLSHLQQIADERGSMPRKIVARAGDEYFLLSPDEVLAFQAEGDLVWIVTAKRKYLSTLPLRTLHEKLAGNSFQRIHRNALVNVNHVRKMSALSSQRWLLTMDNNQEFIVSKRQARAVRGLLSW